MALSEKAAYFDRIADKWDSFDNLETLSTKLGNGLQNFGLLPNESVLDVGCGTGNLTRAILAILGPEGRVHAVDVSARMCELAQAKITDPRVTWYCADASHMPLTECSCDRAICFSVWPHFNDKLLVALELARVLRHGGCLHIWHLIGRRRINDLHAAAGGAIANDILHAVEETAGLLRKAELRIAVARESDDDYLVTATKP